MQLPLSVRIKSLESVYCLDFAPIDDAIVLAFGAFRAYCDRVDVSQGGDTRVVIVHQNSELLTADHNASGRQAECVELCDFLCGSRTTALAWSPVLRLELASNQQPQGQFWYIQRYQSI
jgi:hypothetical protein